MNFQAQLKLLLKNFKDPVLGLSLDESPRAHIYEGEQGLSLILESPEEARTSYQSLATEIEKKCREETLPVHVVLTSMKAAPLSQIKKIIAVASGKGGVGKSTVAVQLAATLAQKGLRVGLLDADIYGPSIPRMMGLKKEDMDRTGSKIIPPQSCGVHVISMGFFVEEEAPLIWRGPMVQKALYQLFFDVAWPELDLLITDLPPGTGDAQLTLAQKIPLQGAIIVSTPQDIALLDARKALHMFKKLEVPILGLIENMSSFECPHCHQASPVFHSGTVREEALKEQVPYLGEIPLTLALREACDQGRPLESGMEPLMREKAELLLTSLGFVAEQSPVAQQWKRAW